MRAPRLGFRPPRTPVLGPPRLVGRPAPALPTRSPRRRPMRVRRCGRLQESASRVNALVLIRFGVERGSVADCCSPSLVDAPPKSTSPALDVSNHAAVRAFTTPVRYPLRSAPRQTDRTSCLPRGGRVVVVGEGQRVPPRDNDNTCVCEVCSIRAKFKSRRLVRGALHEFNVPCHGAAATPPLTARAPVGRSMRAHRSLSAVLGASRALFGRC